MKSKLGVKFTRVNSSGIDCNFQSLFVQSTKNGSSRRDRRVASKLFDTIARLCLFPRRNAFGILYHVHPVLLGLRLLELIRRDIDRRGQISVISAKNRKGQTVRDVSSSPSFKCSTSQHPEPPRGASENHC